MDRAAFAGLLKENKIPSVLLFDGPEENMKQTALNSLRKALLPEGLEEMNETRLENPGTDEIIAAAETIPFLADRRLVILRDFAPLVRKQSEPDDRLLDYLPKVPPTSVLLFYCVQQPDTRRKLYSAVKKLGGTVTFEPLKGAELTRFVTDAFHALGRECDARTADFLIFTSGSDTALLRGEIAKIAALHPDDPRVSPDDVRALATPSAESRVFALVDAVVAGEDAKSFEILRDLIRNGESRLMILALLLRQFRLMQHIRIMQYEKKSAADIQKALGTSPYVASRQIAQAKAFTNRQIKEAVSICLETEHAVKSGRLNEDGSLEAAMLKLLMLRK